jgi:hypothetical protein
MRLSNAIVKWQGLSAGASRAFLAAPNHKGFNVLIFGIGQAVK